MLLIEIVFELDMSGVEDVVVFVCKLYFIVILLGICDGDMFQGNMCFDVNIFVCCFGELFGMCIEIKNLNFFCFMEKVIVLEVVW